MRPHSALLFLVTLLTLGFNPVYIGAQNAQTQTAGQLVVDDPELYFAAMRFIDHVNIESQSEPTAQGPYSLQRALQRQINVSDADYKILVEEASLLKSVLTSPSRESLSPRSRILAINNTQARINERLSNEGSAAFRSFVNTFIRDGLRAFTGKAEK